MSFTSIQINSVQVRKVGMVMKDLIILLHRGRAREVFITVFVQKDITCEVERNNIPSTDESRYLSMILHNDTTLIFETNIELTDKSCPGGESIQERNTMKRLGIESLTTIDAPIAGISL